MAQTKVDIGDGDLDYSATARSLHTAEEEHNKIGEESQCRQRDSVPRKVRFFERVRVSVRYTPRIQKGGHCDTWLSEFDYNRLRSEMKYGVQMLEQGGASIENALPNFCTRGLECRTKKGIRVRRRLRVRAATALFEEQNRQRESGVCDPDRIASVYSEKTVPAKQLAAIIGMKDEKACGASTLKEQQRDDENLSSSCHSKLSSTAGSVRDSNHLNTHVQFSPQILQRKTNPSAIQRKTRSI